MGYTVTSAQNFTPRLLLFNKSIPLELGDPWINGISFDSELGPYNYLGLPRLLSVYSRLGLLRCVFITSGFRMVKSAAISPSVYKPCRLSFGSEALRHRYVRSLLLILVTSCYPHKYRDCRGHRNVSNRLGYVVIKSSCQAVE